ncbi:MAG: chemotaxis protein CheD [Polyangiaceae bacterium]
MAPGIERVQVYLHAGQVFASSTPCEVTTVLGSCVAVLLVDGVRRIGGASHYLLPFDAGGSLATARFGTVAISMLVEQMLALGSRRRDLVAKVFGGAATLRGGDPGRGPTLGEKNIEVAQRRLDEEDIPVVAQDVGGSVGRKVVFFTDEGHVWIKKL